MEKLVVVISTVLFLSFTSQSTLSSATIENMPTLIDSVDSDLLLETFFFLTSFSNRASYETQEEVIAYISFQLEDAGAAIRLHEYEYGGHTWHNLVATIPSNALLDPSEPHFVVGAHIDSFSVSPGADDNASGVAAIMEAARILASIELNRRVDFVFFTLEEAGRIGSSYYASDAKSSGEHIEAMIAVDMIAYGSMMEDLEIVTKPTMTWIAEAFKEASDTYTDLDTMLVVDEACG